MMGRLDTGFWGLSATLPDEPPIEGEQREPRMARDERIKQQNERMAAAVAALKRKEDER